MNLSDECLLAELDDLIPLPKEKEPWIPVLIPVMGDRDVGTYAKDLESYKHNLHQDLGGIEKFREQYEGTFAIDMDKVKNDIVQKPLAYPTDNSFIATNSYVDSNISVKSFTDEITQNVVKEMTSRLDNEIMEAAKRVDMSLMNTSYGIPAHSHSINPTYITGYGMDMTASQVSNHSHNIGSLSMVDYELYARKKLEAEVERLKAEVVTLKAQQLPTSMKLVNPLKEERILYKSQTDETSNGIYTASDHEVNDLLNKIRNRGTTTLDKTAAKEHLNSIFGDLAGVQPMTNPTGSIFNVRHSYDDNISKFDYAMELVE